MKSLKYADEQIEHFRQLDGMTDELLKIIRLELITAYRSGYEDGEKTRKRENAIREYVPHPQDFKSESDYLIALDGWRKYHRRQAL